MTPLAEMKLPIDQCTTNGTNRKSESCAMRKKSKLSVARNTSSVANETSSKPNGSDAESGSPSSQ